MNNNIKHILELADEYFILQHKSNLEQSSHTAYSTAIYTDGKYKTSVNSSTGFIEIYNITDANYLIFLDQQQKVVLYIYENVPDILIKNISDELREARDEIIINNDNNENIIEIEVPENTSKGEWEDTELEKIRTSNSLQQMFLKENGLMDLNDMICDECNSKEFNIPVMCNDNKTIEYQCKNCNTIYRLAPSKYYRLLSKTKFSNNIKSKLNIKYIKVDSMIESDDS